MIQILKCIQICKCRYIISMIFYRKILTDLYERHFWIERWVEGNTGEIKKQLEELAVTVLEHCWIQYDLFSGRTSAFILKGRHRLSPRSTFAHWSIVHPRVSAVLGRYFFFLYHRGRHYNRSRIIIVFVIIVTIFFFFFVLFLYVIAGSYYYCWCRS